MIEKLPVLPSYSSVAITCMVPANSGHTCIQTSPPESKKQQSGSFLLLRWQSVTENTSSLKVKKPTVAMNWNSTKEINIIYSVQFSCSVVSNSLQPHKSQHTRPPCPSPTPGVYALMPIKSLMPYSHLILCCPLLLPPSIIPRIRVFSNESALRIRWPKYWSFSLNISPSNEHPGLISFRMD